MKLFLSDLDGTLIFNDIPEINKDDVLAIHNWNKDQMFGLVTGRDAYFCCDLLNKYNLKADCLITSNGAVAHWKDKLVYTSVIDKEMTVNIYRKLIQYLDVCIPFFTDDHGDNYFPVNSLNDFPEIKKSFAYLGSVMDKDLFEYLDGYDSLCAKITICMKSIADCDRYYPVFKEMFPLVEVMKTSDDYIEMTNKGTDKKKAFYKMLEKSEFPLDDIIFIGDGANDVPLFTQIEQTYVMNSAKDEIKKEAKVIVDTVAQAIEKEKEKLYVKKESNRC